MCLSRVLMGVLKRVNGAVAPGVVVVDVAAVGYGFLAQISFSIVQRSGRLLWP